MPERLTREQITGLMAGERGVWSARFRERMVEAGWTATTLPPDSNDPTCKAALYLRPDGEYRYIAVYSSRGERTDEWHGLGRGVWEVYGDRALYVVRLDGEGGESDTHREEYRAFTGLLITPLLSLEPLTPHVEGSVPLPSYYVRAAQNQWVRHAPVKEVK